jgi:hypothetical protein
MPVCEWGRAGRQIFVGLIACPNTVQKAAGFIAAVAVRDLAAQDAQNGVHSPAGRLR